MTEVLVDRIHVSYCVSNTRRLAVDRSTSKSVQTKRCIAL